MVDQDYKRNKVTVCAHLQNIFNTFNVRKGKQGSQQTNYFDIDKWLLKYGGPKELNKESISPTKEARRTNTLS